MAITVSTEPRLTCRPHAVPVALRELVEAPDSAPEATTARPHETSIHVVEGVVYVVTDEDERALTPGETATIDAGIAYRRWNAGDERARWVEVYCAA
jgi:mannose-6-phosphate isomerase-like protein (cupin superfamily)